MRRCDFITLIGGAAVLMPLVARAQQQERLRRVGVLNGTTEAEFRARYELFRNGLARLGWSEPRGRLLYSWRNNTNKPITSAPYSMRRKLSSSRITVRPAFVATSRT